MEREFGMDHTVIGVFWTGLASPSLRLGPLKAALYALLHRPHPLKVGRRPALVFLLGGSLDLLVLRGMPFWEVPWFSERAFAFVLALV